MTDNINPWHSMLDRQALARQSQTGESYAAAFTKIYEDPSNRKIVDMERLDHLSKQHDAIHGTRLSAIPNAGVKKALADATLEAQARSRAATTGETYAQSFTAIYTSPENIAKRNGSITPVQKSADAAELIGEGHARMPSMAVDYQRSRGGLSYEQSYSHAYNKPENQGLREQVKREHLASVMRGVSDE